MCWGDAINNIQLMEMNRRIVFQINILLKRAISELKTHHVHNRLYRMFCVFVAEEKFLYLKKYLTQFPLYL